MTVCRELLSEAIHGAIGSLEGKVLYRCCMRSLYFIEQGIRDVNRT